MYSTLGEMEIAPRRCAPGPGKQRKSGRASSARLTLPDEPRNLYRWSSSRNSLGSCSASIILRKVWCGSTLEEMTWPRISSPLASATPVARPFLTRMRAIGAWVRISTPASRAAAAMAFQIAQIEPGRIGRRHGKDRLYKAAHRHHRSAELLIGLSVEPGVARNFAARLGMVIHAPQMVPVGHRREGAIERQDLKAVAR